MKTAINVSVPLLCYHYLVKEETKCVSAEWSEIIWRKMEERRLLEWLKQHKVENKKIFNRNLKKKIKQQNHGKCLDLK